MLAAWKDREAARGLSCADPGNSSLRRALTAAANHLSSMKMQAVQRFFEKFVTEIEVRIQDDNHADFS